MNFQPIFYYHVSRRPPRFRLFELLLLTGLLAGCASEPPLLTPTSSDTERHVSRNGASYNKPYKVNGKTYYPMASAAGYSERGMASWYGSESGDKTAMESHFRPQGISAAHKTLPLPCKVRVTNLHNGRSIDVVVNDRGPFKKNRLIDLSHGAAKKLGLKGITEVKVEHLSSKASSFE